MAPEGPPKVTKSAESEDPQIESSETSFYDLVETLELKYCAQLWSHKIPAPERVDLSKMSFGNVLEMFSSVDSMVMGTFLGRTGKYQWEDPEACEAFRLSAIAEIEKIHDEHPDTWTEMVPAIIEKLSLGLPEGQRVEEDSEPQTEVDNANEEIRGPYHAGLLAYGIYKGQEGWEKYGVSKEDTFVNVHLEAPAGRKNDDQEQNMLSKESLTALAESIQSNCPEAKIILAKSWLMSRPIAKRIGFKQIRA